MAKPKILRLDFETRSEVDLPSCGAYKYAESDTAKVLVLAVQGDGPVLSWDIRREPNEAIDLLREAIVGGWEIHAYNSQFEWCILKYVCPRQLGLPVPDINNMRCTAAVCRSAGMRPRLGQVAEFLKVPVQKDKIGSVLIQKFCVPRKKEGGFIEWNSGEMLTVGGSKMSSEEAFEKFVSYCETDVATEAAVAEAMKSFALKGYALDSFLLTARLNQRGVPVDVEALRAAQTLYKQQERYLVEDFVELTGFSPTQTARVLEWCHARGYPLSTLKKEAREQYLNHGDLSAECRKALSIRGDLSFAAIKKIPAMLDWVMSDGRIRGSFKWAGAQKTWRWTSEGPQWQNMKKAPKRLRPVIEEAYQRVKAGIGIFPLSVMYGDTYEMIASMARYFVRFADQNVLDLDYTSVEAMVLPALIDCERLLEKFRNGEDPYLAISANLGRVLKEKYNVPFEIDRDVAKTVWLACIAEGQPVLTDRGLVPIEQVSCCDLVWDGVEWVRHEGVICKGEREVIEYQGLVATPDHEVFCRSEEGPPRKISFGRAVSDGLDIVATERGGEAIRIPDYRREPGVSGTTTHASQGEGPVLLREGTPRPLLHTPQWEERLLPEMPVPEKCLRPPLADEAGHYADATMHQPERSTIPSLRRERDRVQVCVCPGSMHVDHGEPRVAEGYVVGQDRQQRALRSGESQMGNHTPAVNEYIEDPVHRRSEVAALALRERNRDKVSKAWAIQRTNSSDSQRRGGEEIKELAGNRRTTRVYDLVNAGPRHRFTVSGKLVSNCQFQGGWHAVFTATGNSWKREWCEAAAAVVRKENPEFGQGWRAFHNAFVDAMDMPDRWHQASRHVAFGYTTRAPFPRMLMRLPSGRPIVMPRPEKTAITMIRVDSYKSLRDDAPTRKWERIHGHVKDEEEARHRVGIDWPNKDPLKKIGKWFHTHELSYWGHIEGVNYGTVHTYGGSLLQSATQGTAVDLLALGTLNAERQGFEPFFIVHDQCLTPDNGRKEDFEKAMCVVPDWFPHLPLSAEAKSVRSYCKN